MASVSPDDNGDEHQVSRLASSMADVARSLSEVGAAHEPMQRVVDHAREFLGASDAVSVSVVSGGTGSTPASTSPVASAIDQYQYEYGEGPCLDAIHKMPVLYCDDLESDERWPTFAPAAASLGMRSVLSCRLSADRTLGSLNIYAAAPRAFGTDVQTKAVMFATLAGLVLGAADSLERERRRARDIEGALATRSAIGQAQGILMERERLSAEQAFDVLTRVSQHVNMKLRDVAQYIVDTGAIPEVRYARGLERPRVDEAPGRCASSVR